MALNLIPDDYKSDHLFLLVGTNPLPNYVAAKLLARADPPVLHLVISEEMHAREVDQRLADLLGCDPLQKDLLVKVDSSSPEDIFSKIEEVISTDPNADWGLNYTGGKKSMAVHAYRAMEQTLAKKGNRGTYSYLDADTREMVIQAKNCQEVRINVDLGVEVRWQDILTLHGRSAPVPPKETPFQAEFVDGLIHTCADQTKWKEWKYFSNLLDKRYKKKGPDELPYTGRVIPSWVPLIPGLTIAELAQKWHLAIQNSPEYQYDRKKTYCDNEADWIREWLHGKWLEDYVLAEVLKVKEKCNLHQAVASLRVAQYKEFEVDVVAMRGYQLFAISITTNYAKDEYGDKITKQKMFEVITRTRQMGGDEARVALVALSEEPAELEKQVASQLNLRSEKEERSTKKNYLPQARVFGIEHLPSLNAYLKDWFNN